MPCVPSSFNFYVTHLWVWLRPWLISASYAVDVRSVSVSVASSHIKFLIFICLLIIGDQPPNRLLLPLCSSRTVLLSCSTSVSVQLGVGRAEGERDLSPNRSCVGVCIIDLVFSCRAAIKSVLVASVSHENSFPHQINYRGHQTSPVSTENNPLCPLNQLERSAGGETDREGGEKESEQRCVCVRDSVCQTSLWMLADS